jgi:catechol 2,3-dioxygenase-like lactoylglutathione lyase family enzyme
MKQRIGYVTIVVRDYDEARAWYCDVLGFNLVEDIPLPEAKRSVRVAPPGEFGTGILLAKAETEEQRETIGKQTGSNFFLFLYTDDFQRDFHAMQERGVHFCGEAKEESYGTVAVFEDLYGNRWDLIQLH